MTAVDLYNLGYYHYTGTEGYPLNYRKAFDYFMQAANAGYSDAMNYLGNMYVNGKGVEKDFQKALGWYYAAIRADNGNALAAYNLGCMYYNGTGVPVDINKAFDFFDASVKLGLRNKHSAYVESCYMVGLIMMNHYKNNKEAADYFMEAAKYDYPDAWNCLGLLCEKGALRSKGLDVSDTLGIFKQAAKYGTVEAIYNVGRIYAHVQMYDEARPWLNKAASMGYEPAKKLLKMMKFADGSIWGIFKK